MVGLLFVDHDYQYVGAIGLIHLRDLRVFVHSLFDQHLLDEIVDGIGDNADTHRAQYGYNSSK